MQIKVARRNLDYLGGGVDYYFFEPDYTLAGEKR